MDDTKYRSPIVDKTAHLLDAVAAAAQGVSLTELVAKLGVPRSTVYRILNSLSAHGLVARVNGGTSYQLGPRFIELARTISPAADRVTVIEAARPILQSMAERIKESFKISVPDGDDMMTIFGVQSPAEYSLSIKVGSRSPKHVGAAGKVCLAYAGADAIEAYCHQSLVSRTQYTITDPEVLKDVLEKVRGDGFAEDHMESGLGVRALAAPVLMAGGHVIAAVSVPYIAEAAPDRHRLIRKAVLEAAGAITAAIGGP